jgi:hypothetical protein
MRPRCLLALVAILNLATGLCVGVAVGRGSVERLSVERSEPDDGQCTVDLPSLADTLDLPPEKAAKVRAILATFRPRTDAILMEVRPRLETLHAEFLSELGQHLTQDQIAKLVDEFHRRVACDVRAQHH